MKRSILTLALALGALGSLPVARAGAQVQRLGSERPDVIAAWKERMVAADHALLAGEWKPAKKAMIRLLSEICARFERGPGAADLLGRATMLRGLAEIGLGDEREGRWDGELAVALLPQLAGIDFSAYGEVGTRMAAGLPEPLAEGAEVEAAPASSSHELDESVVAPRKRNAPSPKYPYAKRVACIAAPIVVQFVVDVDGLPRHPEVIDSPDPVLSFAALDTVRRWRFSPATRKGEPVAVYYNLAVHFDVPICTNPMARRRLAEEGG
jgi:TonB family protein